MKTIKAARPSEPPPQWTYALQDAIHAKAEREARAALECHQLGNADAVATAYACHDIIRTMHKRMEAANKLARELE